jgi:hypothetical protein
MDIAEYADYFHDGNVINIKHHDDYVDFFLESFPIEKDISIDKRILSKFENERK